MWKEQLIGVLSSPKPDFGLLEQAFLQKDLALPKRLSKYRSVNNYSLKNLADDTVWLADPFQLNDPFDSGLGVQFEIYAEYFNERSADHLAKMASDSGLIDRDEADKLAARPEGLQKLMRALSEKESSLSLNHSDEFITAILAAFEKQSTAAVEKTMAVLRKSLKLCSFSEVHDSIVMWSHYADYHRGFCIEYPVGELPPGDIRRRMLFPVVYADELFDATAIFQEMLAGGRVANNLFALAACLQKSSEWSYEKEWRLAFPAGIIPSSTAYLMPRPSAIFLGAKITPSARESVLAIVEPKGIPVFHMLLSNNSFRLHAEPLKKRPS
jgi:Protein of unknown function (DUF2971)